MHLIFRLYKDKQSLAKFTKNSFSVKLIFIIFFLFIIIVFALFSNVSKSYVKFLLKETKTLYESFYVYLGTHFVSIDIYEEKMFYMYHII